MINITKKKHHKFFIMKIYNIKNIRMFHGVMKYLNLLINVGNYNNKMYLKIQLMIVVNYKLLNI